MTGDRISIEELEVHFRVGVPDEERENPQRLLLTVQMEHDFSVAVRTDDISATIDYYAVTQRIKEMGRDQEWRLIEKLACDIAQMIIGEFGAREVRVKVEKFIIPDTRCVAVEVERRRPD